LVNHDMWSNPYVVLGVAYSCLCFVTFIIFFLSDYTTEDMLEKFREKQERVALEYSESLDEFLRLLEKACGDNCTIAEQRFREKQRSLIRFFNWCADSDMEDIVYPSKLTEPFRQISQSIIAVWEQVSIDPIYSPCKLCSTAELRACGRSVREIATMLVQRLQANPVNFILEDVTQSGTQAVQGLSGGKSKARKSKRDSRGMCSWLKCKLCTCQCSFKGHGYPMYFRVPCVGMTILSFMHIVRILAFVFGVICAQVLILVFKEFIVGGVVILAAVAMAVRLSYEELVNETAMMKIDIINLRSKKKEMETRHEQIKDIFQGMQAVLNLWRYQTLPRLDLLVEVLELASWEKDWYHFWTCEAHIFHQLDKRFGGLGLWLGRHALNKNTLAQVGDMVNKSTMTFHAQESNAAINAFANLRGLFRFAVIRILECSNLPGKGAAEVFVNIMADGNLLYQTKRVELKNTNPAWSAAGGPYTEEYSWAPEFGVESVQLQVRGHDTQRRPMTMGYFDLAFSNYKPGEWTNVQSRLFNDVNHKQRSSGDIHFDIFPCTSVQHLAQATRSDTREAVGMATTHSMSGSVSPTKSGRKGRGMQATASGALSSTAMGTQPSMAATMSGVPSASTRTNTHKSAIRSGRAKPR